jgi:protein-S-isoprenylcysteine O-methyltransferase Ste14
MTASLDWLQWPAMLVTVAAAWLVASQSRRKRTIGFWTFLASNALWIAWGWQAHAWALIVLQVALAGLNVRGAFKNDPELAEAKGG